MIRPMTIDDVPAGLRLCRASRWNQLENDWRIFLDWDPALCRVAEREGRVIGTVAGLRHGDSFSWLSMVLVDPVERGRGIGTRLLHEGLAVLQDHCVRLDATPVGRPIYARSGFTDEYAITRLSAKVDPSAFTRNPLRARPMAAEDLASVFSYDSEVFGADRSRLLLNLFQHSRRYAWIAEDTGNVKGYCFGRPGFLAEQLGPIVAQDELIAADVVSGCLKSQAGKNFIIDTPEFNPAWLSWLMERGFSPARSFLRMSRGENRSPGQPHHIYGITGPEFG